jgi:recombinational DNA repair protein (RecF pathway)
MTLFKTKAIILKISKVKDKDFIYDIFTFDYGRIKVQKKEHKKEKTMDLGYIINCEIETKEQRDIHKIKNIKIKSEFRYE